MAESDSKTGSKYKIQGGNIGAVGDNAHAKNFHQNIEAAKSLDMLDLNELAQQLEKVRLVLLQRAATPEESAAVGQVAQAEIAAKKGDRKAVLATLKGIGKWVLDVAKELSTDVAAKVIEAQIGIS